MKYGKIIQRSTGTKPFLKRFEASVTMERQHSGRPRRAITPENEEVVEEMICSQDYLRTYVSQKRYCQGIKDVTIFCTKNNQKKKNKTTQTSQNTLHEWCHSIKKSRS